MSSPTISPAATGGVVQLALSWAGGAIAGCRVESRRPDAARLLRGKTAAEVLALMPRLFSLCGQAQRAVAAAALDAAAGRPLALPGGLGETLRREAIGEHLWRLLIDWPERLAPEAGASPSGNPLPPTAAAARAVQKKADNATFAHWYRRLRGPEPAPELAAALAAGIGADVFTTLHDRLPPWERPLACVPQFLPGFDVALASELFAAPAASFAATPTWSGSAAEVGALARFAAHPELLALSGQRHGLAARLSARWLALRADFVALGAAAADAAAPPIQAVAAAGGLGYAWTETARGPLCHRVVLAGERVVDYAVIAPTEWNFHPASAWAAGLVGARAETPEIAENLVRLWALALDPCVPVTLTLNKEN